MAYTLPKRRKTVLERLSAGEWDAWLRKQPADDYAVDKGVTAPMRAMRSWSHPLAKRWS